jgi:hypothetical protein
MLGKWCECRRLVIAPVNEGRVERLTVACECRARWAFRYFGRVAGEVHRQR